MGGQPPRKALGDEFAAACLALVSAFGSALTRCLEEMRPAFDALAGLAHAGIPWDQGAEKIPAPIPGVMSPQVTGLGAPACHCLCVASHPGDRGICDGHSVTVVRRWSNGIGNVDVPVCGPCAAAQMRGESW